MTKKELKAKIDYLKDCIAEIQEQIDLYERALQESIDRLD